MKMKQLIFAGLNNFNMTKWMRSRYVAVAVNMLIALALLMLARFIFVAVNYQEFFRGFLTAELWSGILRGGLRFDLATLFYLNALYLVLCFIPVWWKERRGYYRVMKWLYMIGNGVGFAMNLCDCVYVHYTGRRTTATVFAEFSNEDNLLRVFGAEFLSHWWLVLLFVAVMWGVWKIYRNPWRSGALSHGWRYYAGSIVALAVSALCAIAGIRGGVDRTTRPITLSNANQYVDRPIEAAAVLNTPFSIIRSIGKTAYNLPPYMPQEEAQGIFPTLHTPESGTVFKPRNVVVLIVESFSRAFIGELNRELKDSTYQGYTPFVDSLIRKGLTYKNSYANGMKSIDGMPSVLSSIPMMIEPFFLTPAAMNDMGGLAHYLKQKGYSSAFFHGAPNGSMGFEAFSRRSGFDKYVGLTEYDDAHPGNKDFDGSWAIWDEPFLQFFAQETGKLREPFVTSVFTASSHHPFAIPDAYRDTFPADKEIPILHCIRYTDHALRRYFEAASKQPWFNRTLFVITSDHSSFATDPKFLNAQGRYAAPIIFYAPGDSTLRGFNTERLAQQIDIMPTVLGYLGYDKPYVAFGSDLLHTHDSKGWVFNYNSGMYQYAEGDLFMEFDGTRVRGLYNFRTDPLLERNILNSVPQATVSAMEKRLKAFIQQYATSMRENRLLPGR